MPPSVPVYLYDLSKNELLKFKNGDKVQFIGKINIKQSSPPYYKEYSSVWASMIGMSPFGEKLELYDVIIEQQNVSNSITYMPTENPCLISESPPYPNGWTKEQVKEFNEKIKAQPCQRLGG